MRTVTSIFPLLLLLSACGSMRETTAVRDDVYDIPDRQALAAAAAIRDTEQQANAQQQDDYYDPQEARDATGGRDYYDMTYNDPYYYNYGRFGFGTTIGGFGPSYGMGLSYGWPTSFGSMSIGLGTGYGYDPYWGYGGMGGYGYSPYGPYGYYGYGNYGYGYGGYGPYQGPWAGSYVPPGNGYGNTGDSYSSGVVYGHRPSISTSSGNSGQAAPSPRMYRGPVGLLQADGQPRQRGSTENMRTRRSRTIPAPHANGRNNQIRPAENRSAPNWGAGTGDTPSRSGGGEGTGGRISAPRPR